MNHALLILFLLQSSLHSFELVFAPGDDPHSLLHGKPSDFTTKLVDRGGWMRTDKGDVEFGSCVYKDPHGKFSVGWKHLAGKVKSVYLSRGPHEVTFEDANLVKIDKEQVMILDTETGEFHIVTKARRKNGNKDAEQGATPNGP